MQLFKTFMFHTVVQRGFLKRWWEILYLCVCCKL